MTTHIAARLGDVSALVNLLDKGADVNIVDRTGQTALMVAAAFGQREALEILLSRGADVNAQDAGGMTALMYAAAAQFASGTQLLIASGGRLDMRDREGQTAFGHSMRRCLDVIIPGGNGRHLTLWLPRLFRSDTARVLAEANRRLR
jgi:ankyrin repeat protein